MKGLLKRLWEDEEGQDLVEYGLVIVLVGLAAVASMQTLASAVNTAFSSAVTTLVATTT